MALFKKNKLLQIEADNLADPARPIVLLVDDEEANLRVMSTILTPYFRVMTANNGQLALEIVKAAQDEEQIACIISDQRMPNMSGVELLAQCLLLAPDSNRVIVTGFSDITAIIDSINKAEIYRYIVKPFDTNDFVMTIQRAVETYQMKLQLREFHRQLEEKVAQRTLQLNEKNKALEQANTALQEASLTDPLTGLRNRRFLLQQLDADVAIIMRKYDECIKSGRDFPTDAIDLIFFMVDIDHFKLVNDQFGHAAGDLVLVQMRERLQEVFRESDYLVRWGGEEFLALGRASSRADAGKIAERIREAVANRPFLLEDNIRIHKTCSIGFASLPFIPNSPHLFTWGQVIEMADHALYIAKNEGRNRSVGLQIGDHVDTQDLFLRINADFNQALKQGLLIKTMPRQEVKELDTLATISEHDAPFSTL